MNCTRLFYGGVTRELKQTTTATGAGTFTLPNKRFNAQNNSCARVFSAKQQHEMTKFCILWRT